MTAQAPTDGMNLDYPGGMTLQPQTPIVSSPAPSAPVMTDPLSSSQPVQGNIVTDNTFPAVPAPVVADSASRGEQLSGPSFDNVVLPVNPVADAVNNDMPAPVVQQEAIAEPTDPLTSFDPASVVPPIVNEPAVSENAQVDNDGEKESPLQALARKLAELKSELIDVTPSEDNKVEEVKPEESLQTDNMANTQPLSQDMPFPPLEEINAIPTSEPINEVPVTTPPAVSQPLGQDLTGTLANPLPENVPAESLNTTVTNFVEPAQLETPLENPAAPSVEEIAPQIVPAPEVLMDPVSLGTVAQSTEPADNLQPIEASVTENTQEPVMPIVDTPVVAEPLLETLITPVMENTSVNSTTELDENDNTMVDPSALSQPGEQKYPLGISKILDAAVERNASDVHISVGYPVMLRIDGTLIALHDQLVSPANAEELILPVLSDQKKELLEVNREVDLAYTHRHGGEARFRINAFYTRENLSAAFRLIPTRIRTIEELKLPPIYTQFAGLKQGLVLVTGPTGHGKSTTLAAILQHINMNRAVHMLTIEDPIEYIFPKAKALVDQREMHDDTHSWSVALKSALRQDPDVILVGEMRDYETIAATITLAETGHLVFATLHTNSASQTIDRIIDVFPENQQAQVRAQLANILEAVVAQRLIPVDGGGRRAVSEIMLGTPAVRNLIREGKTHQLDNVIRTSADVGMVPLEQSLVRLVREGMITMDKAEEYAVHPEEVVRLLKS